MSEQENPQSQAVPESPESIPSAAPEVDLAARVAELELQVKDVQLRAQAEIQNIQKRAERDAENARKFALERFAGSLIDVVDNLERAVEATPENPETKALRDGVLLTHKAFLDALKRNAVEQVNPVGEPFNAELHQAVSMQPSATAEPNTVTAVLAKGYTLSGRLLRPAMVVVATAG
ncbi:MAG: nucleotide exchange factor GrpE [Moraxellaceae bacterium]